MDTYFGKAANSLVQLLTLVVGIVLGVLIAPRFDKKVEAGGQTQQTSPNSVPAQQSSPNVIPLGSYMGSPAIAANIVLVHELEADHAVVNGYDLLLLDQNIINYLAKLPVANAYELTSIGERSKATTRYSLPAQPKSNPVPNGAANAKQP